MLPPGQTQTQSEEKIILQVNGIQRKEAVAVIISGEIDFKIKIVTGDKDGHFMIKGTIHPKDIIFINIYAPNLGAPKYINTNRTKGKN